MKDSAYWNSQYNYYMTHQPPKAESYYNQSFVDKMNEAQKNIDNLVAEKDKSWAATGQKQDEYDTFYGSMKEYGDVYKNAESEFGVKEAQDTYEKSKKALALAESTLSALPSSINSSSNRVLTQSQREARYNALATKQMSYRDNLLARSSAYEEVWKNARANQAAYAKAEIAGQYSKLSDYNNAFTNAMNEYMEAENRLRKGEEELRNWQQDYRMWQINQWSNERTIWLKNMTTALDRYVDALNTEMVVRQAQRQKELADAQARTAYSQSKLGDSIANYYYASQEAEQTKKVVNAGGLIGRIAYFMGR